MSSLTPKQQQVLRAIRSHIAQTGHSPTVREIGKAVELKSSCSVQKHLESLERDGHISRNNFKYRSIELNDDHLSGVGQSIPVQIYGYVAGGEGIEAIQDDEPETVAVPASGFSAREREQQSAAVREGRGADAPLFGLRVKGASMQDAGIADGDLVIARRQQHASNGEIVIALVREDEEDSELKATVKRFYKEANYVRLEPANPDFSPIITQHAQIIGRVAMAIKNF